VHSQITFDFLFTSPNYQIFVL